MAFHVNYSAIERVMHRAAFVSPAVQLTAADIERTAFRAQYQPFRAANPIFITSLPRAGTTALLEAVSRLPTVATHLYRDMPFVMAPLLWARLSQHFRTSSAPRERAHGDGVLIGEDSPEAFEEILWRALWPEKYSPDRLLLWGPDDGRVDAGEFFADHIKKIVALRRPDHAADGRYVSKNNANIARLQLLGRLFPGARIVVPVREPIAHARSLLKQHRNFLAMHRQEPFVKRYMDDIGHYEFGELHRPIAFPELERLIEGRDPLTLDYWVAYWIAALEHVRTHRDGVILISYEALCEAPQEQFARLCERVQLAPGNALGAAAAVFRQSIASRDSQTIEAGLQARALDLYRTLMADLS